jgi:hypothetical protein
MSDEPGIRLSIQKDSLSECLRSLGVREPSTVLPALEQLSEPQGNSELTPTGARSTKPTASESEPSLKFEVPGGMDKLESFKKLEAKLNEQHHN